MNTKKASIITLALAVVCIIALSGFASARTVSSATFTPFGTGYCTNLDAIKGGSTDGNFAHIYCPSAMAGGNIVCTLSSTAPSGSTICVYAGGSGSIYLYAYYNGQWNQLKAQTLGSNQWIYSATSAASFTQVAVATYSSTGSSQANIDVVVTMP